MSPNQSRKRPNYLEDSDDEPLLPNKSSSSKVSVKPVSISKTLADESDDDYHVANKLAKEKAKIEKKAETHAKEARKQEKKTSAATPNSASKGKKRTVDSESEDAKPAKKNNKKAIETPAKKGASNGIKKDSAKKSTTPSKTNGVSKTVPAKGKAKAAKEESPEEGEGEEEEEEFKWWEAVQGDGTQKWTTLRHEGVMFPPEYEALPKDVKLYYDGQPVKLSIEAEEAATFFGSMLHSTQNVENPVFQRNFFKDFQKVIADTGGAKNKAGEPLKIKEFGKLDFTKIFAHYQAQSAARKALSSAEKKALKAEKDKVEEKYAYCLLDGRKEKVGNFRVEPPGLFRGRGEHPKTGLIKARVRPEQITINIGKNEPIPQPPAGHKWGKVQHDNEVTWLAMWQENINNNFKYVMLAPNSSLKGMSDIKKFERARELTVGGLELFAEL
jgi:DNA topoisomerase-1